MGARRRCYGRAARASLLDAFPLWVVEVIGAWRRGEAPRRRLKRSPPHADSSVITEGPSRRRALRSLKRRDYIVRLATDLLALQTSDLR